MKQHLIYLVLAVIGMYGIVKIASYFEKRFTERASKRVDAVYLSAMLGVAILGAVIIFHLISLLSLLSSSI